MNVSFLMGLAALALLFGAAFGLLFALVGGGR